MPPTQSKFGIGNLFTPEELAVAAELQRLGFGSDYDRLSEVMERALDILAYGAMNNVPTATLMEHFGEEVIRRFCDAVANGHAAHEQQFPDVGMRLYCLLVLATSHHPLTAQDGTIFQTCPTCGQIKIEPVRECLSCEGSGIFIKTSRLPTLGTICEDCHGTGYRRFGGHGEPFTGRKVRAGVLSVVPKLFILASIPTEEALNLIPAIGTSYEEWLATGQFAPKSEPRPFTCPYEWTGCRLEWPECHTQKGSQYINLCPTFADRMNCWTRWDAEGMPGLSD